MLRLANPGLEAEATRVRLAMVQVLRLANPGLVAEVAKEAVARAAEAAKEAEARAVGAAKARAAEAAEAAKARAARAAEAAEAATVLAEAADLDPEGHSRTDRSAKQHPRMGKTSFGHLLGSLAAS